MGGIGGIGGNFNLADISDVTVGSQSKWGKFGQVLGSVASQIPGVGGALTGLGVDGSFNRQLEMIKLQQQIQDQTQVINTLSNISKAKHEAAMSAIRNMK
ncbi:MAG: hypothetical protein U0527_10635 [Candidatus Eisenbacteria bacterium]